MVASRLYPQFVPRTEQGEVLREAPLDSSSRLSPVHTQSNSIVEMPRFFRYYRISTNAFKTSLSSGEKLPLIRSA